jgi:hypothetical protein
MVTGIEIFFGSFLKSLLESGRTLIVRNYVNCHSLEKFALEERRGPIMSSQGAIMYETGQ